MDVIQKSLKGSVMYLIVFFCLVLSSAAIAETTTLDSKGDAFVSGELPMIPTGLEVYIAVVADWEMQLMEPTKSLVWFDVDNDLPGNINVVEDAVLKLYTTKAESDIGQLDVFRAGASWNELAVTWDTRPAENREIVISNTPLGPGLFQVNVTEIVRSWVYNAYSNYGFYIDAPDNGSNIDMQFGSKENPFLFTTLAGTSSSHVMMVRWGQASTPLPGKVLLVFTS